MANKSKFILNTNFQLFLLVILTFVIFLDAARLDAQPNEALLTPPQESGPVKVRAAFHLQDINDIDDEGENFQFSGVLTLTWRDPRQAFDPKVAGVSEKIYQGEYQFDEVSPAWYPQVVLANESGQFEKHGTLLRIQPDGTSILIESINATAEANLSMRRYPFDKQKLEAVFEVHGLDKDEVVLVADKESDTSSPSDIHISQWDVTSIRSFSGEQSAPYSGKSGISSTFNVSVDVTRESFFMVRLVVFPLAMIVILSWAVFWMDRSSLGDRINVSFIGILTAVAYQIVVGGLLPHISYMTLMNGFLNISFLVMSATVVLNLVVGWYDKKGMSTFGDLIDYHCRWIVPLVYTGLMLTVTAIAFTFF